MKITKCEIMVKFVLLRKNGGLMKINKSRVDVKQLQSGFVLAEPIYDIDGKVLFSEGLMLNEKRIDRIIQLDLKTVEIVFDSPKEISQTVQENKSLYDVKKAERRKQVILEETRQEARVVVEETLKKVLSANSVKAEKIKLVVERMIDAILMNESIVLNLSNLSSIDDYMLSHSVNVCVLSLVIGIFLGFSHTKLMELGSGALIHDIGKMLVPQEILLKPGSLTDDEFDLVKKHTSYGYRILKENIKMNEHSAAIALYHHERLDGSGYPNGLTQHNIPIFSKIVSIVDVFDAMTTDRVYSEKVDYYEAIKYLIKHAGILYDAEIVKKFVTVIGYYPFGMTVKLSSGDTGYIISHCNSNPIVKVLIDSNGNQLKEHYEIDLYKNPTISVVDIEIN